ncbi:aspartate 1-decarboxylase [Haloimpatiens sp. FM7330]|uniref:aspartate 1-decarboxylase n=1 Tax=Haloimpatiens sp. FM7330 TaxID=3298610 RepID=UPI0036446C83
MNLHMLKAKIHRATVTEAKLNYVGSITIDSTLLDNSGIVEYEKIQVVNINNGARFETYVIAGKANSGVICLNGAAARHVQPEDKVILMAYCEMSEKEVKEHKPTVIFVNDDNSIKQISHYEKHGQIK